MSPEAQTALIVLEMLAKTAPAVWAAIHGTSTPAEVLAKAAEILPAHGSARAKISALFPVPQKLFPRLTASHLATLKRVSAAAVLSHEDVRQIDELHGFASEIVALDEVGALMSPKGTWGEPASERD